MWREKQAELLRQEIEAILTPLDRVDGLYDLVRQPLTGTGRGLATGDESHQLWSLLPMIVCESISGHYDRALPVAACRQFLLAAADVFDDLEDADSPESLSARCGPAVAINVATTLLILAEKAIARLEMRNVPSQTIVRVLDMINSLYTTACGGQHLDLSLTPGIAVSEEMYFRVAGMKSASQAECACRAGALLATENQALIDTFGKFGHNLGMVSQISNDIQGITGGRDILKRKITLPVIYALAHADDKVRHCLNAAFGKLSESVPDPAPIRDMLFRSGAVHYAAIGMESYRQQARDALSEAERAGANVERLLLFLK